MALPGAAVALGVEAVPPVAVVVVLPMAVEVVLPAVAAASKEAAEARARVARPTETFIRAAQRDPRHARAEADVANGGSAKATRFTRR